MRLYITLFYMVLLGLLLSAGSCSPRVYWPQRPDNRGARSGPRGSAQVDMLEEGRDYQGWTPAPVKCQQQAFFPSHSLKN
jgi:hypothetical protein